MNEPCCSRPTSEELFPGCQVMWLHTPPGGYGFVVPIAARVVRVGTRTATVEVARRNGETAFRVVEIENLRWPEATRLRQHAQRHGGRR